MLQNANFSYGYQTSLAVQVLVPLPCENTTVIRTPQSWTQWCFSYFLCVFSAFTPCLVQSILDVKMEDVACDIPGAVETCRTTSHDDPIYYEEGIMHYCVDNIPSGFAQTASIMLSSAMMPYVRAIADKGVEQALTDNALLRRGLTCYYGDLTLEETAIKHSIPFVDPLDAFARHQH